MGNGTKTKAVEGIEKGLSKEAKGERMEAADLEVQRKRKWAQRMLTEDPT